MKAKIIKQGFLTVKIEENKYNNHNRYNDYHSLKINRHGQIIYIGRDDLVVKTNNCYKIKRTNYHSGDLNDLMNSITIKEGM